MSLTLFELCEKLENEEEVSLLEKFKLTSVDLVNRCADIIEDSYEELIKEYEEEIDED